MPPQKTKGGLLAKLGGKIDNAVRAHAADPVDYGIVRLPGGISNGIARLVKCGFDEFKEGSNMKTASGASAVGQIYFRAAGVVISPESVVVDGQLIPVKGLHTSVMIPLCDTKSGKGEVTSQEQHITEVLNEMKKLGGEEYTAGASSGGDLEGLAAGLEEAAPYFRFSTSQSPPSQQYPNPRVWERWHGSKGLEEFTEEEGSAFTDSTAPPPPPPPRPTGPKAGGAPTTTKNGAAKTPPRAAGPKAKSPPPPDEEPEEFDETEGDLNSLAEQAEAGNTKACDRLTEMAVNAGIDADDVSSAESWSAVVDLIMGASAAGESEEEAPEEDQVWTPNPGDVYYYKPIDPKTKKPGKAVEVEVLTVNEAKQTCQVKVCGNPKMKYVVKWDDLEGIE